MDTTMISVSTVFVLVVSLWIAGAMAVECPSCIHVHYVKGSVQVASMTTFVNDSQNSLCIADPNSVATRSCPDSSYTCGFLDEEIAVFAHLVGEVSLHYYYRDCVRKPLPSNQFLGCLDTPIEELMFTMLWDKVPDSVFSQQPEGSCYCRRIEGCESYKGNGTDGSRSECPSRWFKMFGKCYEWWIILVIVVDIIIIVVLATLVTCCLWRRCPLYYRRSEYKERELMWRPRRHSAPDPGYFIGPALLDTPVERGNIAMPGFGAPVATNGEYVPSAPRRHVALAGMTGHVQPGIYNSRYYHDNEDDPRSDMNGQFTWRTAAPRRFRSFYDVHCDFPDEDESDY